MNNDDRARPEPPKVQAKDQAKDHAESPGYDRALGALYGLALGDALGMATQELSRERAEDLLGAGARFLDGPPDNPISAGLRAGSITDDTAQALILARLLVEGRGHIDLHRFAAELLGWEDAMAASGSLDLLGPSTKAALEAVRGGADPATTGRLGRTNGAAMRIAPVGIAVAPEPPAALLATVAQACRVTHDTALARAGAAAVATVISWGVQGETFERALQHGVLAAQGEDPDLARLILRAIALTQGRPPGAEILDRIAESVGTTLATEHSVPAAFAIAALSPTDAWVAGWLGARLGGDADTIAAIAAAMVGACTGAAAMPAGPVARVAAVNQLDLPAVALALLDLRRPG